MKLYEAARAPSPRRVRIFLAEKGISLETRQIDLGALEHFSEAFDALNPFHQVPVLELDDGTHLTESVAICRYLDELHPEPPLFGTTALERARVEMWIRRIDLLLYHPTTQVFRHTSPGMASREKVQIPGWAEVNRGRVLEALRVIDRELGEGPFIAGERFSVADISGLVALDFLRAARITVPEELTNVRRWHAALAARPSAVP